VGKSEKGKFNDMRISFYQASEAPPAADVMISPIPAVHLRILFNPGAPHLNSTRHQ
jgi:hypothetical protein